MTQVATFVVTGHENVVLESLTELGFALDSPRATSITLLDTFDGRLHRAGLRLQVTDSDRLELELSGPETPPAHVDVEATPRVPADVPSGPLRFRLSQLVDVRALLPQLRVSARRARGVLRDAAGKVVVIAELYEGAQVAGRPDVDVPTATIEVHQVPGYAKQAARVVEDLRAAGVEAGDTDTLTMLAVAAGVDLAGYTASATVPLAPEMPAIDGFRAVLDNLATAVTRNWHGVIDQTDPEFLHDLRIAVRRTRTVLVAAKKVLPLSVLDPARDGFAWIAELTSTPRDLDVYLLEWSRYTDPLGPEVASSLQPVRDLLERRRVESHHLLEAGLRSERAAELVCSWRRWLAEPLVIETPPARSDRQLGRLVAERIARAHAVLVQRGRLIGPDTPAEDVHDLRKDAKKLRYLLECFGGLLPSGARKRYVKRLKALQDNLGEHQDAEVHITLLRTVADELHVSGAPAGTMVAIGQLTDRLDQQRLAARAEFAERFADYDTSATQRALEAVLDGATT